MAKKLIVMVGLPGSGKSYHVNVWKDVEPNMVVFSTDNILQDMVDEGLYENYNEAWRRAIHRAEKQFWADMSTFSATNDKDDVTVVIDRTNLTKKSRARIQTIFHEDDWERVAFVVQHERWKERAQREGKNIPEAALESMERAYIVPTMDEGFSDVFVVHGGN